MAHYSAYVDEIQDLLDAMNEDSDINAADLVGAYLDLSGRAEAFAKAVQEAMSY